MGFGRSGGYRVISELAGAWVRFGHEVTIIAHCSTERPYFPTAADILLVDDQGRPTGADSYGSGPRRSGFDLVSHNLVALLRALNKNASAVDVILANHSLTAWPVSMARVQARKYYYVQAYEPEYYASRKRVSQRVLQWAAFASYHLPLHRIVNSPVYLSYRNLRAEHVVPPGLDFSLMYPGPPRDSDRRATVLGCIGRHEPEKGTKFVLDAYAIMLSRGYNVELHVAYGNLPEHHSALPHCKVVVPRNDAELGEYYRSLDVMIAPGTLQLGAPHYPVMEAMACGIPVVTTGYMPASREANNAWIVPVGNAEAIADAVHEIMSDSRLRTQRVKNALRDIQPFSWDAVAQRMLEVFKS